MPSGIRVTGKLRIVTLGLLIQGFEIGFICRRFCVSCVAIGFELVRAMCGVNHPHTTLGSFLYPVSTFYADVILLGLSDFSVSCSQSGIDGSRRRRMGELGRRLLFIHFLKVQACRYLALGIYDTLFAFDGFLRDFCLGFIKFVRLFIRFLNGFFQFGGGSFFIGKL